MNHLRNSTLFAVLCFISISGSSVFAAKYIEVHGHRGARANYPENTLPAFAYAISLGVDALELDMGVTKDGEIIVNHDLTINSDLCRYENGDKIAKGTLVHSLTLAEIKKFDCGSVKNSRFPKQTLVPGTKMPTLDEVFTLAKNAVSRHGKPIKFNIETKIQASQPGATVDPVTFVDLVLKKVKQYGYMDRIILESFDYRTLVEAKKREPTIVTAALTQNPLQSYAKSITKISATYSSPLYKFLTPWQISSVHRAGGLVVPWTPDSPSAWKRTISFGADAIITDDPEGLIQYLNKTGL